MAATEPTIEGIVRSARNMLRDMPMFFEVDTEVKTSTLRLPHPLIEGASLQVYVAAQQGQDLVGQESMQLSQLIGGYTVDERNGLLKFTNMDHQGKRCVIAGYHYEWFLDEDLAFNASAVVAEHMFQRDVRALDQISAVEVDVIAMGTLVRALWTLITEFSTDIDVTTPEGVMIPARQRFQQVWQLLQHWEAMYNDRAKALNVGLSNIDIYTLRRKALMTGRFVPVYKTREYDDHDPPERVYPPIPSDSTSEPGPATGGTMVNTVEEIGRESADLGFGGWQTLGTNGGA